MKEGDSSPNGNMIATNTRMKFGKLGRNSPFSSTTFCVRGIGMQALAFPLRFLHLFSFIVWDFCVRGSMFRMNSSLTPVGTNNSVWLPGPLNFDTMMCEELFAPMPDDHSATPQGQVATHMQTVYYTNVSEWTPAMKEAFKTCFGKECSFRIVAADVYAMTVEVPSNVFFKFLCIPDDEYELDPNYIVLPTQPRRATMPPLAKAGSPSAPSSVQYEITEHVHCFVNTALANFDTYT